MSKPLVICIKEHLYPKDTPNATIMSDFQKLDQDDRAFFRAELRKIGVDVSDA